MPNILDSKPVFLPTINPSLSPSPFTISPIQPSFLTTPLTPTPYMASIPSPTPFMYSGINSTPKPAISYDVPALSKSPNFPSPLSNFAPITPKAPTWDAKIDAAFSKFEPSTKPSMTPFTTILTPELSSAPTRVQSESAPTLVISKAGILSNSEISSASSMYELENKIRFKGEIERHRVEREEQNKNDRFKFFDYQNVDPTKATPTLTPTNAPFISPFQQESKAPQNLKEDKFFTSPFSIHNLEANPSTAPSFTPSQSDLLNKNPIMSPSFSSFSESSRLENKHNIPTFASASDANKNQDTKLEDFINKAEITITLISNVFHVKEVMKAAEIVTSLIENTPKVIDAVVLAYKIEAEGTDILKNEIYDRTFGIPSYNLQQRLDAVPPIQKIGLISKEFYKEVQKGVILGGLSSEGLAGARDGAIKAAKNFFNSYSWESENNDHMCHYDDYGNQ